LLNKRVCSLTRRRRRTIARGENDFPWSSFRFFIIGSIDARVRTSERAPYSRRCRCCCSVNDDAIDKTTTVGARNKYRHLPLFFSSLFFVIAQLKIDERHVFLYPAKSLRKRKGRVCVCYSTAAAAVQYQDWKVPVIIYHHLSVSCRVS